MLVTVTTFTLVHVVVSLVGIVAGLIVAGALASGRRLSGWGLLFFLTTVATSASGFGFPSDVFLPSHAVGIVSLVVLLAVAIADYVKHLSGGWRRVYAGGVVVATYLNVFVLVVQLFRRLPALMELAPTQSEPPFALTQALVLVLFAWLGIVADRGFRNARL